MNATECHMPKQIQKASIRMGAGRNPDKLMARLIIKFEDKKSKVAWRCVGEKCDHVRRGNPALDRVLKHSTSCLHLQKTDYSLWQEANQVAGSGSLGSKAETSTKEGTIVSTQMETQVLPNGQKKLDV